MSNIGKSLLKGAEEALAYAKGNQGKTTTHHVKVPERVNVSKIREQLNMTRKSFSDAFGFSVRTLEKWERGERIPEGPSRAYLTVIAKNPKAVRNALK